jgi:hypothetical protein
MGKTSSKPLAARHGRGTAWAWHAIRESAFIPTKATLLFNFEVFHPRCVYKLISGFAVKNTTMFVLIAIIF